MRRSDFNQRVHFQMRRQTNVVNCFCGVITGGFEASLLNHITTLAKSLHERSLGGDERPLPVIARKSASKPRGNAQIIAFADGVTVTQTWH